MNFKFNISEGEPLLGQCIYYVKDYSFDYILVYVESNKKYNSKATATLLIGTLQVEIDIFTKRLYFFWGYQPLLNAKKIKLPDISPIRAKVELVTDIIFEPGESISYDDNDWPIYIDKYVLIGEKKICTNDTIVEFAEGNILVIRNNKIIAVILYPTYINEQIE